MAPTLIRTVIIYIFLSFAIRLMGKRQIGELEASELVSALLVSEIASLPIADPDIPIFNAIVPCIIIVTMEIFISAIKNKSEKIKRIIDGVPSFIIYKGKIMIKELDKNRLSANELLSELRSQGVGDFSKVDHAILEPNGKLSVITSDDGELYFPIINDGVVNRDILCRMGLSEDVIVKALKKEGIDLSEVFIAVADTAGNIKITKRSEI